MKRLLSLFLSFALLFTAFSLEVSAAETESSGHDSLVQKACSAFPEYAAKMQAPQNGTCLYSSSSTPRELLVSETRPVSDREYITYSEYSDGLILLSGYEFTADSTTVNSITGAISKDITIDIEATCVNDTIYNGYFTLKGVSYSLRYSDFDIITNAGTASRSGYCTSSQRTTYTQKESLTGYATIAYDLSFQIGPSGYYTVNSELILYVGEDTAVLDHIDRN